MPDGEGAVRYVEAHASHAQLPEVGEMSTPTYFSRGIPCYYDMQRPGSHGYAKWWLPREGEPGSEVAACDDCHEAWRALHGLDVKA